MPKKKDLEIGAIDTELWEFTALTKHSFHHLDLDMYGEDCKIWLRCDDCNVFLIEYFCPVLEEQPNGRKSVVP